MDNPNFTANIACTFETEHRRNDSRSGSVGGGSVYANPPDWAGFSLRKLWDRLRGDGKPTSQPSGEDRNLQEASSKA